jgi:hypothetical protein
MLTRPLKALFLGALILVVTAVVFVARPTPVLGVDGESLGRSVEGFLAASGPCEELKADGRWSCFRSDADSGGSSGSTYIVEVDRWGCWDGRREGPSAIESGAPLRINGCVTLLSHII